MDMKKYEYKDCQWSMVNGHLLKNTSYETTAFIFVYLLYAKFHFLRFLIDHIIHTNTNLSAVSSKRSPMSEDECLSVSFIYMVKFCFI